MDLDVQDWIRDVEDAASDLRDRIAERVLDDCKQDAPVGSESPTRRTPPGGLRDSLRIDGVFDEPPHYSFEIVSDLPYAQFTDEVDTSPHFIFPVFAHALRFWWEQGPHGPDIYQYRYVRHPGTKGQRWFASHNQQRMDDALMSEART